MSWSFQVRGEGREDTLANLNAQAQAHAHLGCPYSLVEQAAKKLAMAFIDEKIVSASCSGISDGEGGGSVSVSINT